MEYQPKHSKPWNNTYYPLIYLYLHDNCWNVSCGCGYTFRGRLHETLNNIEQHFMPVHYQSATYNSNNIAI